MRFPTVLAAALIFTATTAAATAAAAPATTLHLTEKQTFQHYLDKGPKGDSPGDVRTFGGAVFVGKKRVGHDRIHCVIGGKCNADIWLAKGTLRSYGFVATGPRFTAPVTGGSGIYKGAKGTVRVASGPISTYLVRLTR